MPYVLLCIIYAYKSISDSCLVFLKLELFSIALSVFNIGEIKFNKNMQTQAGVI